MKGLPSFVEDDLTSSAVRRGEQPPWIVPDGLWQRIEPLLPKPQRKLRYPGRKRIPDRQVNRPGDLGDSDYCTPAGATEALC